MNKQEYMTKYQDWEALLKRNFLHKTGRWREMLGVSGPTAMNYKNCMTLMPWWDAMRIAKRLDMSVEELWERVYPLYCYHQKEKIKNEKSVRA